jgi:TonB-linked SusC/RagA family outer membrane protein
MKKKRTKDHPCWSGTVRKSLLVMKLALFLMVVGIMQSVASVYSQNKHFNMNEKEISIKDALRQIENKSEFRFFYEEKKLDVESKVGVNANNATISEILDLIFDNKNIEYKVLDNNFIVLKPKTEGNTVPMGTSQEKKTLTGKVSESSGFPLPGASVSVKGTTTGTITDVEGNYTLNNVPENATIVFSFVGMRTMEFKANGKATLNVKMEEETVGIEEVVAVAYGAAKKKDLTGSISKIDSKLISLQSNSTVSQALEGAVAGLQVSSVDGQPGIDMGIRVRGVGSANLNSSGALVVIDGVPAQIDNPLSTINNDDIASVTVLKDAASTALYGSRGANGVVLITTKKGKTGKTNISFSSRVGVTSVGPFDINKIDNSKDYYEFAWKSIYNSYRYGVNGTGAPQNWTSNVANPNHTEAEAAAFASQHLFNYTNSETKFGANNLGNYMAYSVPGATYTPDGTGSNASSTMSGAYLIGPDGRLNPDAKLLYSDNYSNVLLENNIRQEYNISANGGTDKIDYFVSMGYLSDPSYISNSKFDRYSGRSNINAKLYDWLKVGANVSFARTSTQAMGTSYGRNAGSNQGNVFRFINGTAPIVPVYAYNQDGSYRTNTDGTIYNSVAGSTYSPLGQTGANYGSTNIVYSMKHDLRQEVADVLGTRTYAEISFLKDFKFTVNFSLDKDNWTQTRYMNSVTGLGKNIGGLYKSEYNLSIINTQEMLSYNKDFKKHHVDAMAVHEYNDWEKEQISWGSAYELIPGFLSSSNFVSRYVSAHGSMGGPSYGHDIVRMESYLSRLNYIYSEKYYFSASVRADGSSKFKKDRWGTFWSVGGGWRISSEDFMASTAHWLDNLKIRTSYGVIGNSNAIGNYSGYRTWGYGTQYTTTAAGTGTPNGTYTMSVGGLVNDALTWENTKTLDAGADFSIFKRINGSIDFYNRLTDNTFYNQPVNLMAVGQESLQSNSAVIRNRGIELELSADIIKTKDLTWNVTLNGSHYKTILVDVPDGSIPKTTPGLPEYTYEANGEGWSASGAGNAASGQYYLRGEGRDWYNLWIYKYAGVDQETGLPLYFHKVTATESSAKTYGDVKEGDDVKVKNYNQASKYEVGDATPKWIGGFTTSVRYKDFDFTAVMAYQLGGKYFSVEYGNGLYLSSSNLAYNPGTLSKDLIGNTWTPENKGAKYPMQWYGASYYDGATFGSWKYTDMALFSASYLRVKNITIGYTVPQQILSKYKISKLRVFASGDNMFFFSAAKGVDPSMSLTGGMEVGAYTYPTRRTISFGINLDF